MKKLLTFALLTCSLGCAVMQRVAPAIAPVPEVTAVPAPAMQYKARTDLDVVQLPSPTPDLGDCVGANKTIVDPDFKTTMVRVTDCNTDPRFPAFSYEPVGGGSAMANPFSANEKWIAVADQGNRIHILNFDPVKLQVGAQVWTGPGSAFFDRTLANVMWNINGSVLSKVVMGAKAVQVRKVYDYKVALPKGFAVKWHGDAGCNTADTICAAAFSEGIQDTGELIVVWQRSKGYRVYNTMTGKITGQWGALGTVNIADRYAVHQTKLSFLGDTLIIAHAYQSCPDCDNNPYLWNIATTSLNLCQSLCTGHWAPGYKSLWNNSGVGANGIGQFQVRAFNNSLMSVPVIIDLPPVLKSPLDAHISYNNANSTDTNPIIVTNSDKGTNATFTFPWVNEILVVDPVTKVVHREGHTFITGKSPFFSASNAIGPGSPKGDLIMFATDWQGKFANGTTPRSDVVIARLW